jgi:hypothetical protein
MADQPQDNSTRTLFRIAGLGTALAFGAMVGSLFAVRSMPNGLTFDITPAVIIAFFVAAVIAWFYWRMVARLAGSSAPELQRKRFVLFSIAMVVVGILSFLYPIKFIPPEKRRDVTIGLTLAIACITGVGVVMWRVRKFLEADQKRAEDDEQADR